MVNLPSVQKCRVICPNGDFCIFILMSVFKAYETGNCWEMSISNIYRLQLFLYGVWFDCRIFYFSGDSRLYLLCFLMCPKKSIRTEKKWKEARIKGVWPFRIGAPWIRGTRNCLHPQNLNACAQVGGTFIAFKNVDENLWTLPRMEGKLSIRLPQDGPMGALCQG